MIQIWKCNDMLTCVWVHHIVIAFAYDFGDFPYDVQGMFVWFAYDVGMFE